MQASRHRCWPLLAALLMAAIFPGTHPRDASADEPPAITSPPSLEGREGELLTFTADAHDPDGDVIEGMEAQQLPGGARFTVDLGNGSGTFAWTPSFTQAGTFEVVISAESACRANGVSEPVCVTGNAVTTLTVANVDRPPLLSCPAVEVVNEDVELDVRINAEDPDGDGLVGLSAGTLPAGASFVTNANNTIGTLTWTPDFDQAGEYEVVFTASNAITTTAALHITVQNTDRPPAFQLAEVQGAEGVPVTLHVDAVDPDGDSVVSYGGSPLPSGALLVPDPGGNGADFQWTPGYTQGGIHTVTLMAVSCHPPAPSGPDCLIGYGTLELAIRDVDRPPNIAVVRRIDPDDPTTLDYDFTTVDPDGDPITSFSLSPLPTGAKLTQQSQSARHLHWAPSRDQEGTYNFTITVQTCHSGFMNPQSCGATSKSFSVVAVANQRPIAHAGELYAGIPNVPITFSAAGSFDPDGDQLSFVWDFGDGTQGTGFTTQHVYQQQYSYEVGLTVRDGIATSRDYTTVDIWSFVGARAFNKGTAGLSLSLAGSKPWCIQVEPNVGSASNLDVGSLGLWLGPRIPAISGKTSSLIDTDNNGIIEACACFRMDDLRPLFRNLSPGTHVVIGYMDGVLDGVGPLRANYLPITVTTYSGLAASISPNPPDADARLTFVTMVPGMVRIDLFDIRGRLVRRVLDSHLEAGYHEARLFQQGGQTLPAGVFFYRVQAPEGRDTGRFLVVH